MEGYRHDKDQARFYYSHLDKMMGMIGGRELSASECARIQYRFSAETAGLEIIIQIVDRCGAWVG